MAGKLLGSIVRVAWTTLVLAVVSGAVIYATLHPPERDAVAGFAIAFAGTVAATWLGAFFAFRSDQLKQEQVEHQRRTEAIARIGFELVSMSHDFRGIREGMKMDSLTGDLAFIAMPSTMGGLPNLPTFDLPGLTFFLWTHSQLIGRVHLLRDNARTALVLIAERDKLISQYIDPIKAGFTLPTPEQVAPRIPAAVERKLRFLSKGIVELVQKVIEESQSLANEISDAWASLDSGRNMALTFRFPEKCADAPMISSRDQANSDRA